MSTSKYIDILGIAGIVVALVVAFALLFASSSEGSVGSDNRIEMGYEQTLFDKSVVHALNIEIDDWQGFLNTCENEEYVSCNITIDGEEVQVVGLRAKGNTSLSSVRQSGGYRYSFKLEFDHYVEGGNYHGLDKLSLNNLIQDSTYMKDYLTYTLMGEFGVNAPLCSYVDITVNGEDWGLYLAVEGVEESFLQRNYGSDFGNLYKPDSMGFGGGRGNGRGFDMDEFQNSGASSGASSSSSASSAMPPSSSRSSGASSGSRSSSSASRSSGAPSGMPSNSSASSGGPRSSGGSSGGPGMPGGGGMGRGSNDVKLQYIDDNQSSYPNIFNNAKTGPSAADKNRLIRSLKNISEGVDLESSVDIEQVIRYFVVHNYVCNSDSYTGTMTHNYYLYEKDGQLSMIPWDYNLAFGTFMAGDARASVNDAIDTPLQANGDGSLPLFDFIVNNEECLSLYHEYFAEFLDTVDVQGLIESTEQLIAPYVQKDPTAFYTYEDHQKGVETLKSFCRLRSESVQAQLNGTIPSTDAERTNDTSLVDASDLSLSTMGSMGGGGRGGGPQGGGPQGGGFAPDGAMPGEGFTPGEDFAPNGDFTPGEGFTPDGGFTPGGAMPEGGFTPDGSFTPGEGFAPGGAMSEGGPTPGEGFTPGEG